MGSLQAHTQRLRQVSTGDMGELQVHMRHLRRVNRRYGNITRLHETLATSVKRRISTY